MPFHSHHQQSSGAGPSSAGQGIYQAAHALGAIGAPGGNLRIATSGTTAAGTDALMPGSGNAPGFHAGGQTAPPVSSGLPGPGAAPSSTNSQQFETPRRSNTIGRAPEELHINPGRLPQQDASHSQSQQQQHQQQQQQQQPQQMYQTSQYTPTSTGPNISLQQATPQSHYNTPQASGGLPGSLQPGSNNPRPGPSSAYTAPTTVPTMPQIQTNSQQYTLPTRSNTNASQPSHSYSRSSPAGLDQKYIPFSNTPETPKYNQTPGQRYYATTPTGAASNSPLGLADIRPRANSTMDQESGLAQIFTYNENDRTPSNSNYLAPWPVYAFDWCKWPVQGHTNAGKMAVGSYLEDTHNFIQILDTQIAPQEVNSPGAPPYGLEYVKVAEATCSYPVTRILWEPPSSQKQSTDLLATSGDHLRLWSLPQPTGGNISNTINRSASVNTRDHPPQKLTPLALLSNSKSPEHTAPLTSLDWNTLSPKLIITSSIDTTCTIWDIPTLTAKTQLIAHDKEVFDVRFCAGSVDVFVSCGADGSVRMFDLRSLEHSTIIYEPSDKIEKVDQGSPTGRASPTKQTMSYPPPLLRLAASPHDSHLLATFAAESNLIRILDVRQPGQALLELKGHAAALNSIEWSPSRRGMLASGADDCTVLIWDLLHSQNGAVINGDGGSSSNNGAGISSQPQQSAQHGTATPSTVSQKGPYASWRCDYEVGNLSWAPQSALTSQGGDWVGVCGGRGIWGVKL